MNKAVKEAADQRLKQFIQTDLHSNTPAPRSEMVTARSGGRVIAIRRARPAETARATENTGLPSDRNSDS